LKNIARGVARDIDEALQAIPMTMFFLERETAPTARFYTCGHKVNSPWFFVSWINGEPMAGRFPLPVEYTLNRDLPLGDLVFTVAGQFVVSARLLEVIRPLSKSIEIFPSVIRFKDQKEYRDYATVNFTRTYACADWDRSQYTANRDLPGEFKECTRLVLSRKKLPEDGLFRLAEDRVKLIVNQAGKDLIEAGRFEGIAFKPVECA
jgi:hypothetical protein